MMLRLPSLLLAFVGLFAFPWPLAAAFALIAALFTPPVALLFGVLVDLIYFVPGAYPVPLGTILGLAGFMLAELVHGFVKTRIMSV